MGEVVAFKKPEPDEPETIHAQGLAICAHCKHEWHAVVPLGVTLFECPSCSTHLGALKHDFVRNGDVWTCKCGCDLFRMSPTMTYCIGCGVEHVF